ncbi:sensor histidine kinase [Aestuariibacter salexigens]|uniref:sensor histidine kinase n=1 Tax=Aestuariibacter salexigens TaxID=226010 RepID=UPI0003FA6FE3|nr:two-component regulator propeller domain-containing protein [Aestuariibacter salexigens]
MINTLRCLFPFSLLVTLAALPLLSLSAVQSNPSAALANTFIQFDIKVVTPPQDPSAKWFFKLEANQQEQSMELLLDDALSAGGEPSVGEWRRYRFDLLTLSRFFAGIDLNAIDKVLIFPSWQAGKGAVYRIDNVFIDHQQKGRLLTLFDDELNPYWPAWSCCTEIAPRIVQDSDANHQSVVEFNIDTDGGNVLGFNTLIARSPSPFDISDALDNELRIEQKNKLVVAENDQNALYFSKLQSEAISSVGTIYAVIEDQRGFMWFGGSDGLARYDGYGLRIYKHNNADTKTLSNNSIWDLLIDQQGLLWIATDYGLNRFDYKTQTFTHFLHDPEDQNSISSNIVKAIVEDDKGNIWAGTYGGGLNRFNVDTQTFSRYRYDSEKPDSLSNDTINALAQDHLGNIWIGTDHGLNLYQPEQDSFVTYYHYWGDETSLESNRIRVIREDKQQRLWVGTFSGLNLLDRETGRVRRVQFSGLENVDILDIDFSEEGDLWLATGEALIVLDPEQQTYTTYSNNPFQQSSFEGEFPSSIYRDENNDWWLGAFPDGINYVDHRKNLFTSYQTNPQQENSLSHNSVLTINEDKQGKLWIGTDGGGLNVFDRQSGQFRHYLAQPNNPQSLSGNAVLSATFDRTNKLWIGAWQAPISILDPQRDAITRLVSGNQGQTSFNDLIVWSAFRDSRDNLWLGTIGDGVLKYDPRSDTFSNYMPEPNQPDSFPSQFVWSIFEDRDGALWFGSSDGLVKMGAQEGEFIHYFYQQDKIGSLNNNIVLHINQDEQGTMWIATRGGGLNRFDPETQTFTAFDTEDGLPDDVVTAILNDNRGFLWLSTFNGLCRFDPNTNNCINFSDVAGLSSNKYNIGAARKLSTGELAFGSVGGLVIFNPADIVSSNDVPPIVMTDFQIANQSAIVGAQNSPLTADISVTERITLTHQQSMFSIEFSALDYHNPEKNQYAYKLQGYDKNWNDIGYRRRATYTNLDPGTYVFNVKGANSEGVWNEQGASVTVTVLPPPWRSWWAYTLYLLVLLSIVATIVSLQLRKLAERKQLKLALWASGDELWTIDLQKRKVMRQNPFDYLQRDVNDSWLFSDTERADIHPDDLTLMRQTVSEKLAKGQKQFEYLYRARMNNGEWVWLQDRGKVVSRNAKGQPIQLSGTTKNIHQLKATEAELKALNRTLEDRVAERTEALRESNEYLQSMQAQLVESEKMASLGTVVVGVSHELNTPVGNAVTALSTLKHELGDLFTHAEQGSLTKTLFSQFKDKAGMSLQLAQSSLRKVIDIIQSFRKISADQSASEFKRVQLNPLLNTIKNDVCARFANISTDNISIACTENIELTTYTDTLTSVITQLIENASKHAGEKVIIHIGVSEQQQDIYITVSDNGVGMSEDVLAKVFEPFYTTDRGSNLGLGMYVVYNEVNHLLKGSIRCESAENQGTTFTVILPKTIHDAV